MITPPGYWLISKTRARRILVVAALTVVALGLFAYLTHALWLTALADYLIASDQPRPADAIIVLGGGTGDRERTGARLFREGYAPEMLTTGHSLDLVGLDLTFAELSAGELEKQGVPADRIYLLKTSDSTCDDARLSRQLLAAQNARAVLIVSDPFHLRRAKMIFEREYAGSGIAVIPVAASPSWFRSQGWWTRGKDARVVVEEYIKLGYYTFDSCKSPD